MRAHACIIIIIICTRTCFTHDAAYIVAIGLHRATMSYPSRDFSAARNIFCLNLKRTAFGNVKTTLGLVLAALQVILVPSTNVRRIAHSLIHEPFKERLLLTRLREAEEKKTSKVSRGSFYQSRPGQHPPLVRKLSDPKPRSRARSRASSTASSSIDTSRAHTHRHRHRRHLPPPQRARDDTARESDRRYPTLDRASIATLVARSLSVVVLHRRAPSVSPTPPHRHRTFCVFFFIGVVRFWVPPKAATTTRVVDTASIVVHESESRSGAGRDQRLGAGRGRPR